jgi:PhnB protein
MLLRHADSPEPPPPGMLPPGAEKKIMHGALRIGESIVLVSDGRCTGEPATFSGISLALHAGDDAEVERLFGALEKAGSVQQALTPTFFATRFGVVTDRFGVQCP